MAFELEIKVESKEISFWLDELLTHFNIHAVKEWVNKYNSYVVYDYEPFCLDGFFIRYKLSSFDKNQLDFLKFVYENKIKTIKYLNNCLDISN